MNFNNHSNLIGQHAFLGASKFHWIRYDDEKIANSYLNHIAVQRGTELHELAANLIKNKIKLPKSDKTLNKYVNDAIGFRLVPEQVLCYSDNCYGTTDAISTLDSIIKNKLLRISDLKTGVTPAHMEQLYIYAALFCLEYKFKPSELTIECRLYQNDMIIFDQPTAEVIVPIMDRLITSNKIIDKIKMEAV